MRQNQNVLNAPILEGDARATLPRRMRSRSQKKYPGHQAELFFQRQYTKVRIHRNLCLQIT